MTVMTGDAGRPEAGPGGRARERRTWWLAFALFAVACGSWALALPVMTGPDEAPHAIRAAAVVRREFIGSTRNLEWAGNTLVEVQVPEAYLSGYQAGLCFLGEPHDEVFPGMQPFADAGCLPMEGGDRLVPTTTYEQRGQPVYYALAGLPSLRWTGEGGVVLGRLVGALIGAAALASALVSMLRLARPRLGVVALATATTPAVLYLAGVMNSAGMENTLAVCAWASGLALVRVPDGAVDRRLVLRTGIALALLAVTRGFSPLYVLAIAAVLVVVARPGRVRALLRRVDVWIVLAAVGVGGIASALWVWHIHERLPLAERPGTGWTYAAGELWWFGRHAIGVFGTNDVIPPVALHVLWLAAAVGVVVLGLRGAKRSHTLAVLGLLVGTEVLQVSAEGLAFPPTGFWWQGRYVLPLLVGIVLTAAAVADGDSTDASGGDDLGSDAAGATHATPPPAAARRSRAGPAVLALLVALNAWAFLYAMRHYGVGHDGPASPFEFLFDPDWSPQRGPAWLFALVYTAALGAVAALAWTAASAADPARPAAAAGGSELAGTSDPDHDGRPAPVPAPAVRT